MNKYFLLKIMNLPISIDKYVPCRIVIMVIQQLVVLMGWHDIWMYNTCMYLNHLRRLHISIHDNHHIVPNHLNHRNKMNIFFSLLKSITQ
jgi:hypothetical protein